MASPMGATTTPPRKWTAAEDRRLQAECEQKLRQTGAINDWIAIAEKISGRTNKDCRKRWSKIYATLNKGPWSSAEDARLRQGIAQHGFKWISVAQVVESRNADQCAKRWQHSLDPQLDRSEWTAEDDQLLCEAVRQYGQSWRSIAEAKFPRRSKTDIKNRYAIILRRMKQRPSFQSDTPDHSDDADESSFNVENDHPTSHPRGHANMMIKPQTPPMHHNPSATTNDQNITTFPICDSSYLTSGYSSSPASFTSSLPGLTWDQTPEPMPHSQNDIITTTTDDMNTIMDLMDTNHHDGMFNTWEQPLDSEMLTRMELDQLMGLTSEGTALHPRAESITPASNTLTITIEDADPFYVDGITSMLLRSNSKWTIAKSGA